LHQVGTSSLLIYMMHGHTYIKSEILVRFLLITLLVGWLAYFAKHYDELMNHSASWSEGS